MTNLDLREVMVNTLISEVKTGRDINVLVSDSTSTSKINPFLAEFPERVINVGIAEQNLVGMAAGLSMGGIISVTANASPFLISRSNEQVKVDISYADSNVKLIGLNPGFAYGSLGPTHHSIDDISVLLGMGNIQIFAPADAIETREIIQYAIRNRGPKYIRLDSIKPPQVHKEDYTFTAGEPVFIKKGKDISIITLGTALHDAINAEKILKEQGIEAEIISIPSVRPLNTDKISRALSKTSFAVTVEEHSVHGGIGSIVSQIIAEEGISCRLKRLGVTSGNFAPASPRDSIKELYHLDGEGIAQTCLSLLKRK